MVTDETWRAESFEFPMRFAPKVNFDGVADVRFTKGWGDQSSDQFWAYAFAWHIRIDKPLTEDEIENYMALYFDGLMNVVNRDKSFEVPASEHEFSIYPSGNNQEIKGEIRFYDAFFSQEMMKLNVKGTYEYCEADGRSIYFLCLSPKPFEDGVWVHMQKVKLKEDLCK